MPDDVNLILLESFEMFRVLLNVAVSVTVILGASWLVRRAPTIAGFVTALPITTMLVLLFSHMDGVGAIEQAKFAKSLLLSIPLSCVFLVPFLIAPRMNLGFGLSFAAGIVLLVVGYLIHRKLLGGVD